MWSSRSSQVMILPVARMAADLSLPAYCPLPLIRIAFFDRVCLRHFWCMVELKAT